jgi:hypothetical protein
MDEIADEDLPLFSRKGKAQYAARINPRNKRAIQVLEDKG